MNIGNLLAQSYGMLNQMSYARTELDKSLERLSTGKAEKNPGEFIRASQMELEARTSRTKQENLQTDIAWNEAKDNALATLEETAFQLAEISTSYENVNLTLKERKVLEKQAEHLFEEMGNVLATAKFNGETLFAERWDAPWDSLLYNLDQQDARYFLDSTSPSELLSEIADYRGEASYNKEKAGRQLEYEMKNETIFTQAFERIENVDVARETLAKAKYELLLNTNISLFSQNIEDNRQMVLQLLR